MLALKLRYSRLLAVATIFLVCACGSAKRPIVAMLTDFGLTNEAVGLCHGAIAAVSSDIEIIDLCHNVVSFDIAEAALMLHGTSVLPKGAVIVGVVDPGVGTEREPCAIKTKNGLFYVGPNNGLFSYIVREQGVEQAVTLDPKRVNPKWKHGTFDGRDLFSPAAAQLSIAQDLSAVGSPMDPEKLILLPRPELNIDPAKSRIDAVYLRTDEPYGNLWTNIGEDALTSAGIQLGDHLRVECGGKAVEVPFVISFGYVKQGEPLGYLNSSGTFALAINMGNFAQKYGFKPGAKLTVAKVKAQRTATSKE